MVRLSKITVIQLQGGINLILDGQTLAVYNSVDVNVCQPQHCLNTSSTMLSQKPMTRPVSARAVLIALMLTIPNSHWLMINWGASGYGTGQSFPTVATLYFNVIFILFLLIGVNRLIRIIMPHKQMNDGELMVIYVLLAWASSIAGHDTLQILWPMLTYPIWNAQPENEWADLFHRHIPDWLTVKSKSQLVDFYKGESTLHTWKHLGTWITPVLWWSALIIALMIMMLCLTILVRRQWVYREKLSYPVIQIPLQLTEQSGRKLLSNRLLWMGFILAGGMNLLNGLKFLYPVIPGVGGSLYNIGRYFQTKPLNAIGYLPVAVYPFAIGLSFFIPLDLSFSIWFFYLFHKLTCIWGAMLGIGQLPGFPFVEAQSFGGWMAIGVAALWITRKSLLAQFKRAFSAVKSRDEDTYMVRVALVGFVLGWMFLLFFFISAGVSVSSIFAYFGLFFILAIAMTRVRAEVGPPSHDVPWRPEKTLVSLVGTRPLGPEALTTFSILNSINRSYRCHPMPVALEGFKAAERRGISPKRLAISIILVTVVATVASAWAFYSQGYHYGAAAYGEQAQCRWTFDQLKTWLVNPQFSNRPEVVASASAVIFTGLLMVLRRRFVWWPFHPAGYALSLSRWNTSWYWFSIFVSWLLKWILFRIGGLKVYRKAMPFFAGLVLGEFIMGAIWTLIGIALERPMYRFMF